jgi:nitrogen fixation/metabolism regulation signal transduction histidine kinase
MVFRNFRLNTILRVLFLCASIYLFFYLLQQTSLYATTFIVGLVALFQIWGLLRYVENTNRYLSRFLLSIRYNDFTQTFQSSMKGSAFEDLNLAFNEVIREFQKARMEKEEHFRYLQTVVQHVEVGLIAFNRQTEEIELMNGTARRLLKAPHPRKIDDFGKISDRLVTQLRDIKPRQKVHVKIADHDETLLLSIRSTDFMLRQQRYSIVSFQNIQSELEEKELEAWQTLIRTLTHEIMNSITPISSLASTAGSLLEAECDKGDGDESIGDVLNAVKTIEKRSTGLINFVENYRQLTRIPSPKFELVQVTELFDRVGRLMEKQFEEASIQLQTSIDPETLELTCDADQIEQVLINLTKNAVEAVEARKNAEVDIAARMDGQGRTVLQIADNGPGIQPDALEKIFIPFFTTKKEGSGIGLSLSKQIMRLHRGTLGVTSKPDEKTIFTLRF